MNCIEGKDDLLILTLSQGTDSVWEDDLLVWDLGFDDAVTRIQNENAHGFLFPLGCLQSFEVDAEGIASYDHCSWQPHAPICDCLELGGINWGKEITPNSP
jgi:hypothetical protein